jgi:hypothetical protein
MKRAGARKVIDVKGRSAVVAQLIDEAIAAQ